MKKLFHFLPSKPLQKKKKRFFLLLEVLLALSLLSICALPLLKNPLTFLQVQWDTLTKIECDRLADVSFAEVKILLYQNEIKWEEMVMKKSQSTPYPLERSEWIHLPGCQPKEVKRFYKVWVEKEKQGQKPIDYRLVGVDILLSPHSLKKKKPLRYRYFVTCQKLQKAPSS